MLDLKIESVKILDPKFAVLHHSTVIMKTKQLRPQLSAYPQLEQAILKTTTPFYGVLNCCPFTRRRGIDDSIEATPFTRVSRSVRNRSKSYKLAVTTRIR